MKIVCVRALARTGVAVSAIIVGGSAFAQSGDVNVYTYRESKLIQPLFDAFHQGYRHQGQRHLGELRPRAAHQDRRRQQPGRRAAHRRYRDGSRRRCGAGITQPIKSDVLDKVGAAAIPRPGGPLVRRLDARARGLRLEGARAADAPSPTRNSPTRSGRARSASAPASTSTTTRCSRPIIAHHGEAKAEEWLKGVKANLAQKPSGGDRETARDIAAGKCDIGIGNTYYWALMNNKEADKQAVGRGHQGDPADVPGRRHPCEPFRRRARQACAEQGQRDEADRMAGRRQGAAHARRSSTTNIRVRAGIEINPTIAGYGKLNADPIPLSKIADNKKAAANLVDKVGFDN